MALSRMEKLGAACAFVPLLSTISGLIQALVYYNKPKTAQKNLEQLNENAENAHRIAQQNFLKSKDKCYDKLWKASLVEMIPVVNIGAAIYSAFVLNKLSGVRKLIENPKAQEEYLFKKHNLKLFNEESKNRLMSEVLILLDQNKRPENNVLMNYCYGFLSGKNEPLPTVEQLLSIAREDYRNQPERPQVNPQDVMENIRKNFRKPRPEDFD